VRGWGRHEDTRARGGAGWKGAREYGEDRSGDRRALGGGWVDLDCSSGEPLDGWKRWEIWMWGRRAPGKGRDDGGSAGETGGGDTGRECPAWHETRDDEGDQRRGREQRTCTWKTRLCIDYTRVLHLEEHRNGHLLIWVVPIRSSNLIRHPSAHRRRHRRQSSAQFSRLEVLCRRHHHRTQDKRGIDVGRGEIGREHGDGQLVLVMLEGQRSTDEW